MKIRSLHSGCVYILFQKPPVHFDMCDHCVVWIRKYIIFHVSIAFIHKNSDIPGFWFAETEAIPSWKIYMLLCTLFMRQLSGVSWEFACSPYMGLVAFWFVWMECNYLQRVLACEQLISVSKDWIVVCEKPIWAMYYVPKLGYDNFCLIPNWSVFKIGNSWEDMSIWLLSG